MAVLRGKKICISLVQTTRNKRYLFSSMPTLSFNVIFITCTLLKCIFLFSCFYFCLLLTTPVGFFCYFFYVTPVSFSWNNSSKSLFKFFYQQDQRPIKVIYCSWYEKNVERSCKYKAAMKCFNLRPNWSLVIFNPINNHWLPISWWSNIIVIHMQIQWIYK